MMTPFATIKGMEGLHVWAYISKLNLMRLIQYLLKNTVLSANLYKISQGKMKRHDAIMSFWFLLKILLCKNKVFPLLNFL
jgi:hypothetical protein